MDSFNSMESSLNSNVGTNHRGNGLSIVRDFINDYGGSIKLWSGHVRIDVKKDIMLSTDLAFYYQGTLIEMEALMI